MTQAGVWSVASVALTPIATIRVQSRCMALYPFLTSGFTQLSFGPLILCHERTARRGMDSPVRLELHYRLALE